MQWAPFDVKVMEHARRVEQANRVGSMHDQLTDTATKIPPDPRPSQPHLLVTLGYQLMTLIGVRLPVRSH
jgi:hypothetical protein